MKNSTKAEWYKNRILWKSKRNKLLENSKVYLYEEFKNNEYALIRQLVGKETEILIVMWGASNCWTLLCVDSIYSFHNGNLNSCKYDDIKKNLNVKLPKHYKNNKDIKDNVEFIYLETANVYVWAPKGSATLALMNLLMMFPLKIKDNNN